MKEEKMKESKKVLLAINPELYTLAKRKADQNYMSFQEYVYHVIRQDVVFTKDGKSKAGRPKKTDDQFIEYFTRER